MARNTDHEHHMTVISWTPRVEGNTPAVLFACTRGICSRTVVIKYAETKAKESDGLVYVTKRTKTVPPELTPEQFELLKTGEHFWPEIEDILDPVEVAA